MSGHTYDAYIEMVDAGICHLQLTEEQFRELTSAAFYGSGWFRYREGAELLMVNLRHALSVKVVPYE